MKGFLKAFVLLLLVLNTGWLFAAVAPTVTITTESDPCEGTAITVTATPVGEGDLPVYQWTVNGVVAPETGPVLLIKNGVGPQAIRCKVTNTITGDSGTSELLTVNYLMNVSANVQIYYLNDGRLSNYLQVCEGTEIIIGTMYNSRTYQKLLNINFIWQVNGVDISAHNEGVLYISTLKPGDVVTCKISYTGKCVTRESFISNVLQPVILPVAQASVSISSDKPGPCTGPLTGYTAVAKNAGNSPTYQWLVNGANAGSNSDKFSGANLAVGDRLICKITGITPCGKIESTSNEFVLTDAIPEIDNSVVITSSVPDNVILQGEPVTFTANAKYTTDITYQWQVNGINAGENADSFTGNNLNNGDIITCTVFTGGLCVLNPVVVSNTITILIKSAIIIPNTFTPNNDGINDTWNITALLAYPGCTINVYNRYGQQVYYTYNYVKGWDGTLGGKALPAGVYYYVVNPNDGTRRLAGWVTILR